MMLVVTNFSRFPSEWKAASGERGRSVVVRTVPDFVAFARCDEAVFVVNCDPRLVFELAGVFIAAPALRRPLVAVDLVLRRPRTVADRLTVGMRRFLLSRVDHYVHYFRNLQGYQEVYGIGPERSSFVPFKVNIRDLGSIEPHPDGDYILCFGRSLRDYDTFFDAVERLPYPSAIARPDWVQLRVHGARFTRSLGQLPRNIQLLDDDGSMQSQVRILSGAKLVVLPILRSSMAASGISTALNAMLLGKCVIGSEGPGMSDVFDEEILSVPSQDPGALASTIERAWTDNQLRLRTTAAGRRYAWSLGGEPELYQRIIDRVVSWYWHRGIDST
jgi:glycosyltransferase involved in cell wall biosynthesis